MLSFGPRAHLVGPGYKAMLSASTPLPASFGADVTVSQRTAHPHREEVDELHHAQQARPHEETCGAAHRHYSRTSFYLRLISTKMESLTYEVEAAAYHDPLEPLYRQSV